MAPSILVWPRLPLSHVLDTDMRAFQHPQASEIALETVLYALSDPIRLEIVRFLSTVREASSGELDGGRPKSSVSHHFRVLRDSGLLHTRIVGKAHLNSLRTSVLDARFPELLATILSQK